MVKKYLENLKKYILFILKGLHNLLSLLPFHLELEISFPFCCLQFDLELEVSFQPRYGPKMPCSKGVIYSRRPET